MFVVTRMEEENSNFYKCLEELKTQFGPSICPIVVPFDKYGTVESYINLLEMKHILMTTAYLQKYPCLRRKTV